MAVDIIARGMAGSALGKLNTIPNLRGVEVREETGTTKTIALVKDSYDYIYGELTELTVTDFENGRLGSTIFFTSGATPTVVTIRGKNYNISSNKDYLITLYNNRVFISYATSEV